MSETARLPDFVIIGAMKSGTTTLYRWLEAQPEIALSRRKEPDFFSRGKVWAKGLRWYQDLFAASAAYQLVGEASTSYTSPEFNTDSARRMSITIPRVRLIYVVRDPVERLRSHYRHEVQRGRERRTMPEALRDPSSKYVHFSRYFTCLQPYIEAFPRDQICVVRFEDLFTTDGQGWSMVLHHLGIPQRPLPTSSHNVTREKPQYTKTMLKLWEWGILREFSAPTVVRRIGKRLLTRTGSGYLRMLDTSLSPVSAAIVGTLSEEAKRLAAWLGMPVPMWEAQRQDARL